MQKFKQGDEVICIERCGNGTSKGYLGVVGVDDVVKYNNGGSSCRHLDNWRLISSAKINMISVATLTKAQKAGLSKDDQALIQRGIISNDLELSSNEYVLKFLFEQNRKEIAAQAAKEVAEAKAEAKKVS